MEVGGHNKDKDDGDLVDRRIQLQHSTNDVVAAGGLGYVATAEETPPQGNLTKIP